jgi:hypothetical protein
MFYIYKMFAFGLKEKRRVMDPFILFKHRSKFVFVLKDLCKKVILATFLSLPQLHAQFSSNYCASPLQWGL